MAGSPFIIAVGIVVCASIAVLVADSAMVVAAVQAVAVATHGTGAVEAESAGRCRAADSFPPNALLRGRTDLYTDTSIVWAAYAPGP